MWTRIGPPFETSSTIQRASNLFSTSANIRTGLENDSKIQVLLEEKRQAFRAHQQDTNSISKEAAYKSDKNKVQAKLREMQDSWLSRKADEIQKHTDANNYKCFYDTLKTLYGPQSKGTLLLLSAEESVLITEKNAILKRRAEYFNSVLNRESTINSDTINSEAIDCMPQVPVNSELAAPPSESEVTTAIKHVSSGKAPDSDSIPAEIYKAGGPGITQNLTELFTSMWEQESIPQELKDATIVHLYKRKDNRQLCDNHWGISLQEFFSAV